MVINGANLKDKGIQNSNDNIRMSEGTQTQENTRVYGRNTQDSYTRRTFADRHEDNLIYSREEKKNRRNDSVSVIQDEIAENIKEMQEQLDTILNQVSTKGYCDARESYGLSDDTPVHGIVTVVERIRIKLAAACDDYENTGNISVSDIEAVMGSATTAYSIAAKLDKYSLPATEDNVNEVMGALDRFMKLGNITLEQADYLSRNGLEPTIENVYMAQNSAASVKEGNPLTDKEWEQLKPQADEIIKDTFGMETADIPHAEAVARWMLEHDLELNADNLKRFVEAEGINIPELDEETVTEQIVQAMTMGKDALDTRLTGEHFTGKYVEDTFAEIESYAEGLMSVTARRQLEEIRLLMTREAGLALLKRGIEIDTTDLEFLIDELKKEEKSFYESLGAADGITVSDGDMDIIRETGRAVETLRNGPAYIVAEAAFNVIDMTVRESSRASERVLADIYREADKSYEALMTRPDAEYGDSIRSAFRNTASLLNNIGLADTEENRRAVRILGYNQMEISTSNVGAVVKEDREYQYLLKNLTPRMVLHCIREGVNPLDTDIHELNDKLEELKEEIGPSKEERFSEFLWKLDNSGQIDESEREAYIGIYRLLNMAGRNDSAAIGALVSQGAEVTLQNLLTAARSAKHKGMDYKVDTEIGFLENDILDNSITEQLRIFYEADSDVGYENHKRGQYKALMENEEALRLLAEEGETPTINMLNAAAALTESGGIFRTYLDAAGRKGEDRRRQAQDRLDRLLEASSERSGITDSYKELEQEMLEELTSACDRETAGYEDIEELRRAYSGFKLLSAAASRQESYQIPVEISGELTAVRLRIIRGTEESGKVTVAFSSERTGSVKADFKVKNNSLDGFLISSTADGMAALKGIEGDFTEALSAMGITVERINYAISEQTAPLGKTQPLPKEPDGSNERLETRTLYGVAQTFLSKIKEDL